jgi:hypothetical protein
MKAEWIADTVRLNCTIRTDIKLAMEKLAAKKHRFEGGYVGLGRVFAEAAILLLEKEGMPLDLSEPPSKPVASARHAKPPKSLVRRRKAVVA